MRFRLENDDGSIPAQQEIEAPSSCRFLTAGLDGNGDLCVWAEVDTKGPQVVYTIHVIPTGEELPPMALYHYGTVTRGKDVWHVYG